MENSEKYEEINSNGTSQESSKKRKLIESMENKSQKSKKKRKDNKKSQEISINKGKDDKTSQEISKQGKEIQNEDKPRETSEKREETLNNQKPEGNNKKKKKKRNEKAIFGNYRHYYGYRLAGKVHQDPRFKVFKKEWFYGKDCLDIGCNEGLITIEIAKKFSCQSILGIDIDKPLIETAGWNLKGIPKEGASNSLSNASETDLLDSERKDLLGRVSFQRENYVMKFVVEPEKYDTILCLSVTKWIHLNWGDDGLMTLFANIWKQLRPGGIFVLEPQPWKSYQKNYQVSEIAMENYNSLTVYPEHFQEILLDKIGFRTVENISESVPGSTAGFNRPILLFRK